MYKELRKQWINNAAKLFVIKKVQSNNVYEESEKQVFCKTNQKLTTSHKRSFTIF